METIARIRREHLVKGKTIKEIARDLNVSRSTVRKVLRSGETAFEYERKARLLPDYFDAALQRWVKPLFARGDYDTAVFRAFKEVETRVRKKSGFKTDYGRGLMLKAFGESGPLMAGGAEGRRAAREMFPGAISFCKNPSWHHEIAFDDAREVVDMISFANQLLRIVDRL